MYGVIRATTTLLATAFAGFLIWLATRINDESTRGYWSGHAIVAGAGFVLALSQLLSRRQEGRPRISASVCLFAFVPIFVAAGWVLVTGQPHSNWFRDHILAWSGDIHISGLVTELRDYLAVLAFGIGLVLGAVGQAEQRPISRDGDSVWRRRTAPQNRVTTVSPEERAAELSRDREAHDTGGWAARRIAHYTTASETTHQIGRAGASTRIPAGDRLSSSARPPRDQPETRPFLLFVPTTGGYVLVETSGTPPALADEVDLPDLTARLRVTKLGPSPLPDDDRMCAYLEPY